MHFPLLILSINTILSQEPQHIRYQISSFSIFFTILCYRRFRYGPQNQHRTYLEVWGHFQLSGWCVTSPFLMAVNLWKRVLNQSSLIILSGNRFQICIKTLISVTAFDYQYKGYFRKKYEREKWYNSFHTLSILKKRSSYKH